MFNIGFLKFITIVNIQIKGEILHFCKKNIILVSATNGIYKYLENILYILKFSINLIFAKKLYKKSLKRLFDTNSIWIIQKNKKIIHTQQFYKLYIVKYIFKKLNSHIIKV